MMYLTTHPPVRAHGALHLFQCGGVVAANGRAVHNVKTNLDRRSELSVELFHACVSGASTLTPEANSGSYSW